MAGTQSASQFKLNQSFRTRLYVFMVLIISTIVIFAIQLVNFQIIQGSELKKQAAIFGTRTINIKAPRGNIFDRNYQNLDTGIKLVSSYPTQDIILKTGFFKRKKENIRAFVKTFAKVMGHPEDYYSRILSDEYLNRVLSKNEDITLLKNINQSVHERIAVFDEIGSKISIVSSSRRIYHLRAALAHVTGYIGPPSKKVLRQKGVKSDDLVGITGLEKVYNHYLRGEDGLKVLKHSSSGYSQEEFVKNHPIPGKNLVLTIDAGIQMSMYQAMQDKVGVVIALRPNTGEVLGMYSNPSYDPQILSWSQNKAAYRQHLREIHTYKSFQNRAIQNLYPPASTFKPIVALAALSEGKFKEDYKYKCTKKYTVKAQYSTGQDHTFHCYDTHGTQALQGALAHSCSTYFYNMGRQLGSQNILQYARLFGLEVKTGIDLPGEIQSFLPSKQWKRIKLGETWYVGDTVLLSIGQGFINSTPMSIAAMYAGFANNGTIYQPYLLKEVRDPITDDVIYKRPDRRIIREIPLPATSFSSVKKGLLGVTTFGTARYVIGKAGLPPIAGKTGTAQTRSKGKSSTQHGWFVGWGPIDAPDNEKVLVLTFLEYGGGGASGAGPVSRDVFKAVFEGKKWDPKAKKLLVMDKKKKVAIN